MALHHPALEWIWIVILGLIGLSVGLPAWQRLGVVGGVLGFIVGAVGLPAVLLLVIVGIECARRAGPRLPACHSGTCKGRLWPSLTDRDLGDYERTWVGDESALRCRCGRLYVTRQAERRFMELTPDGCVLPYRVHRDYRGWFPDDTETRPDEGPIEETTQAGKGEGGEHIE